CFLLFFFNSPVTTLIYTLSLHDALPIFSIRPDWKVGRSFDLMTRGGSFYAIWDEERGLWSTDIYDVQRLVDADLMRFAEEQAKKDRKSTRLNSSHSQISYAVFCLKKKKQ